MSFKIITIENIDTNSKFLSYIVKRYIRKGTIFEISEYHWNYIQGYLGDYIMVNGDVISKEYFILYNDYIRSERRRKINYFNK